MYSPISLHLQFSAKEILSVSQLPEFCTLIIKDTRYILYAIKEGKILLQSMPHYLVNTALFEYVIHENTKVDFYVAKASIVMLVMLSGHSILSDEQGNVLTETHGNCCYLSHLDSGKYSITLLEGHHKLLLLNINPNFIVQHAKRFPELQPVLQSYLFKAASYFHLERAPIATGIFKLLKKLNQSKHQHSTDYDRKIIRFLGDSLNSYHKNLVLTKISSISQQNKAQEIASFIEENFREQIVNYKAQLALHFCVSEKTMLRLAKKQFGRSLHQKVIELRLLYGLKQLQSTDKSVQEIADLTGYDRHYFSKLFKRQFGISPTQARKPLQN